VWAARAAQPRPRARHPRWAAARRSVPARTRRTRKPGRGGSSKVRQGAGLGQVGSACSASRAAGLMPAGPGHKICQIAESIRSGARKAAGCTRENACTSMRGRLHLYACAWPALLYPHPCSSTRPGGSGTHGPL